MENNKLTLTKTNKALSTQFAPQSPQIRDWIKIELGNMAIMFGQPMTKERLTLYAEELQNFKQYQLQTAFSRLRRERKSSDFGFPLVADFIEHMKPEMAEPDEWQGISVEEKRKAEKEWLEDQKSGFIAEIKSRLKEICQMKPKYAKKPIREIREVALTDAQWEERWQRHDQKREELKRRGLL